MKSFVQGLFNRLGLKVIKYTPSPYENLEKQPRYQKKKVQLLGRDFKIADSFSFFHSYREIFIDQIYKFNSSSEAPVIVDCGANCGTSILYFKDIYPKANIIGVEADPNIFSILESNIRSANYEDVTLLNKAVSKEAGTIDFFSEGADGGRIHPLEDSQAKFEVECIKLDQLLEEPVDFLKIDIEGAETEVICDANKLDNVSQLFIEYHSFKDTEQTLGQILDKLTAYGFRYYIHTQFCSQNPLVEKSLQLGMDLQLNIYAHKIA
ncbi:FkbM family methyltransferase [Stanieria sp. NIES-3757]|nr:FkbM family methyltransferase [Stanieria sp. NIES-3757]